MAFSGSVSRGLGMRPVVLDVTRTVMRAAIVRPTGIDRVERAYLDWAVNRPGGAWLAARLGGEGGSGGGSFGSRLHLCPPIASKALAAALSSDAAGMLDFRGRLTAWRALETRQAEAAVRRASTVSGPLSGPGLVRRLREAFPSGGYWLNAGHENLSAPLLAAFEAVGLASVVLLHDLIPITHPEFARAEAAQRFRARLDAALRARRLIYNSLATERGVAAYAALQDRVPPRGTVLPLGIAPPPSSDPSACAADTSRGAGHFVQLGTIEGRKNHVLILMLWRGLSEGVEPERAPHLHIVGRRGWSAEQAFAMLDRGEIAGRTVFEHNDLSDGAVAALMAGARALLFPSFAEGYGLPLGEALAAGVPVIAADLPALRELGGDVPEWIAPQDGPGWLKAVRDYAQPGSPRRNAQLARMTEWKRPEWPDHFEGVEAVLADLPR
ncbi:MAG: glycosyltransferase [Pseudomonadota bacterium]